MTTPHCIQLEEITYRTSHVLPRTEIVKPCNRFKTLSLIILGDVQEKYSKDNKIIIADDHSVYTKYIVVLPTTSLEVFNVKNNSYIISLLTDIFGAPKRQFHDVTYFSVKPIITNTMVSSILNYTTIEPPPHKISLKPKSEWKTLHPGDIVLLHPTTMSIKVYSDIHRYPCFEVIPDLAGGSPTDYTKTKFKFMKKITQPRPYFVCGLPHNDGHLSITSDYTVSYKESTASANFIRVWLESKHFGYISDDFTVWSAEETDFYLGTISLTPCGLAAGYYKYKLPGNKQETPELLHASKVPTEAYVTF